MALAVGMLNLVKW